MSLTVAIHPEAVAELEAEVMWYEDRGDGLGLRLRANANKVVRGLLRWPDSGRVWPGAHPTLTVRSHGVSDYPFRVVYAARGTELFIAAFAHNKRKPGYWRDRFDDEV